MAGAVILNQPGVYLVDADGNVVTVDDGDALTSVEGFVVAGKDGSTARFMRVASDGTVRVDPTGTTTQPISAAALPLPAGAATESTLAALNVNAQDIETILTAIRDTDGIKKITESLPAGTNRIGSFRLVSATDTAMDLVRNTSIPNQARGLLVIGEDASGVARAADVRLDTIDNKRRLQIEGRVSITAPTAPPSTTPVTVAADSPLSINSTTNTDYLITAGKTFYVQQIACGCEGDSTERGSVVEIYYIDGATPRIIDRIYINGFTQYGVFPSTGTARDGTPLTGDGSTKYLRISRRRLSGSSQEVDAVVRGYEA